MLVIGAKTQIRLQLRGDADVPKRFYMKGQDLILYFLLYDLFYFVLFIHLLFHILLFKSLPDLIMCARARARLCVCVCVCVYVCVCVCV